MSVVTRLCVGIAMTALGVGFAACSSVETSSLTSSSSSGSGASTGVGGASATASSASSGGGGSTFIDCPEDPTNFSKGECDLLNQDCPQGEHCYPKKYPNGETAPACVKWSGVKGLGVACDQHEECAAGLFCAFFCAPACCRTAGVSDCVCNIQGGKFEDPKATLWMCNYLPACTLFSLDACKDYPDTQCHVQDEGLATCAPPSQFQMPPTEGDSCEHVNDCGNMQVCYNKTTCRYSCLVDSYMDKAVEEGGCPENYVCKPPNADAKIGACLPT